MPNNCDCLPALSLVKGAGFVAGCLSFSVLPTLHVMWMALEVHRERSCIRLASAVQSGKSGVSKREHESSVLGNYGHLKTMLVS